MTGKAYHALDEVEKMASPSLCLCGIHSHRPPTRHLAEHKSVRTNRPSIWTDASNLGILESTAMRKRDSFMDKNSASVEPVKRSHGGARPGGGKPKSVKWPSTLATAEAREKVRQYITERLGAFLDAMADNILGIRHLMMRDPKTGKCERITGDVKQIDEALKTDTAF